MSKLLDVRSALESLCEPLGLEVAPFRLGWYNDALDDKGYAIHPSEPDTVAFVVLSSPSMFEKAFVPFVKDGNLVNKHSSLDAIDQCMQHHMNKVCAQFPIKYGVESILDFEVTSDTKRPKLLAQLAAHVAAAARCYKQDDLTKEGQSFYKTMKATGAKGSVTSSMGGKVYPICLHPKYGGWFAIRGILIFKTLEITDKDYKELLTPQPPLEILKSEEDIATLLYLYNNHWADWRFRDVGLPKNTEKYSELQKEYFGTLPGKRQQILTKIISS